MTRHPTRSATKCFAVRTFIATTGICLAAGHGVAQEPPDTFALDPIVVTATRLPAPRHAVPATVPLLAGARRRRSR